MRVALIVAGWDPASAGHVGVLGPLPQDVHDTPAWSDAAAWLGVALGRLGFRAAMVGGAGVQAELGRALGGLGAEDSLLVHVSGRLARRGVLRVGAGQWLPLRALGEALAARPVADVSVIAELVHGDDAVDALVAADHVASAVSAIGARERGWGMVAAVRSAAAPVEGVAFTRLLLDAALASRREEALFSLVYERVRAMPESLATAQSFTLVRGRTELELAPPPPPPAELDALVETATQQGRWRDVVDLRRQRLATHASPRQRVRELVAIARVLQQELGDAGGAVAALEEAHAIEPRRVAVLQALRRGYEIVGRWASVIEVAGMLADLTPMPTDRAALRYEQARTALDRLQDEERALGWLQQALEEDPAHAEARRALALLHSSLTPPPMALPADPEARPSVAPAEAASGDELDPATHARAFEEHRREGRADEAFLCAMALEELGAAGAEHAALLAELRSVAPVRARGTLDAEAWELLRPWGMDAVLTALFAAVARAAVAARVEQLVAHGRLVALDPAARLDEASTASVVRSFQWAARVLGVGCPDLFAMGEVPGEIAAVRAPEPSTAVGPSIVSGRSAKDLAFLAGRHLVYYRPEHQVLVYFPTREELTRLLTAAVQVTRPGAERGESAQAVAALASRLERHLREPQATDLALAVRELEERGGKFSVSAWTRNVELMAARAGLLLCGDLATAAGIVSTESRDIAGLGLDAKRRDLVAFCVSEEHAKLRARFVAAAGSESVRPPAAAAGSSR